LRGAEAISPVVVVCFFPRQTLPLFQLREYVGGFSGFFLHSRGAFFPFPTAGCGPEPFLFSPRAGKDPVGPLTRLFLDFLTCRSFSFSFAEFRSRHLLCTYYEHFTDVF